MTMIHSMGAFSDLPEAHWRWIVAHEIGHQYWLEHVMAKDPEARLAGLWSASAYGWTGSIRASAEWPICILCGSRSTRTRSGTA